MPEKRFFPWNRRVAATLFLLAILTSALAVAADIFALPPLPSTTQTTRPAASTRP
ncbi:MAG TPA: hypothetical protein VH253_16545 [Phycisphaerae bacterium]|nr:hypothetical protein [Phycisphaerae bacterium]